MEDFLIDYPFWSAVMIVLGIYGGAAFAVAFVGPAEKFGDWFRRKVGDLKQELPHYWRQYVRR